MNALQQQVVGYRAHRAPAHTAPVTTSNERCVQNVHMTPVNLSPARIRICLATIGWSERELSRRTGNHHNTVRRWLEEGLTDPAMIGWLLSLEQLHRENPCPALSRPNIVRSMASGRA